MASFQYFGKLRAGLMCVLCFFSTLQAEAEESGLMLCTDINQNSDSYSYIVFLPELLTTQEQCDDENKKPVATDSNLRTSYGQCLSVNVSCLAELSGGFEQSIDQIKFLSESGQVSPVVIIPIAKNAGIRHRAGVAALTFLIVSQIYLMFNSGAELNDALALSLLAAGFTFLFPGTPAYLWSLVSAWIPGTSQRQAQTPDFYRRTENYGSSSNTYTGSSRENNLERINLGRNIHKFKFN